MEIILQHFSRGLRRPPTGPAFKEDFGERDPGPSALADPHGDAGNAKFSEDQRGGPLGDRFDEAPRAHLEFRPETSRQSGVIHGRGEIVPEAGAGEREEQVDVQFEGLGGGALLRRAADPDSCFQT